LREAQGRVSNMVTTNPSHCARLFRYIE
jgi:hypothetical protein